MTNWRAPGRHKEWRKWEREGDEGAEHLILGSAELGYGIDDVLVEVGGPLETGLGVRRRRQHQARRPVGARHLARPGRPCGDG